MVSERAVRIRFAFAILLSALALALPTAADSGLVALVAALTAGVTTALVIVAVRIRTRPAAGPAHRATTSLRTRARLSDFLRLRDPGAPGRARPRAPSPGSAAA